MIAKILSDNLTYAQVNSENPNICFLHGWGGESNNWKNISTIPRNRIFNIFMLQRSSVSDQIIHRKNYARPKKILLTSKNTLQINKKYLEMILDGARKG